MAMGNTWRAAEFIDCGENKLKRYGCKKVNTAYDKVTMPFLAQKSLGG
ncbi:hypothetical protein [Rhizobium mayense]|uniref:Transposase n=1 Tax=Rhizobium mayense TaxID=1312184 RepID=A0ABT7K159_9HYPH|nr:hypothetical protein [Rhizobium mayense]MDL2402342.1 hypothetical protein [Rhizobium mayense]